MLKINNFYNFLYDLYDVLKQFSFVKINLIIYENRTHIYKKCEKLQFLITFYMNN